MLPVAIVLDVPDGVCIARNAERPDRDFGAGVVKRQAAQLRKSLGHLNREGFRRVHVLRGIEEIAAATIVRERLLNDRRDEHGPFDVVGDVHGCRSELETLLDRARLRARPRRPRPSGGRRTSRRRRAVFLGDLVDRGPDSPGVLRLVMGMVAAGHALCLPGNHENKLVRALGGRQVTVSHGLERRSSSWTPRRPTTPGSSSRWRSSATGWSPTWSSTTAGWSSRTPASRRPTTAARRAASAASRCTATRPARPTSTACPCATRGPRTTAAGPWCSTGTRRCPSPRGSTTRSASTPGACSAGGSPPCATPRRRSSRCPPSGSGTSRSSRLGAPHASSRASPASSTSSDVLGKRVVETAHHGRVTIREENAAGALEVMSRFALHPRWLPYLPPTMAPVATSRRARPARAPRRGVRGVRRLGVTSLVCEEKHMGSRAVVLVHREPRRRAGCRLHPHRPLVLRRRADGGAAGRRPRRRHRRRAVGRARHRLAAPRRRAAAVVGEGRGAAEGAVRRHRRRGALLTAAGRRRLWRRPPPWCRRRRPARPHARPAGRRGRVHRGLPALLLADRRARRRAAGAVPGAGLRGPHLGRPRPRVAPRRRRPAGRPGPDRFRTTRRLVVDTTDPASTGGRRRVVGGAHRRRRRGHGRQAGGQPDPHRQGAGAARPEGARPRVPPADLRPRLPPSREPRPAARAQPPAQALAGAARVRPRARVAGPLRRGEPLWRVHEAVFAVLALESEPVDPRL